MRWEIPAGGKELRRRAGISSKSKQFGNPEIPSITTLLDLVLYNRISLYYQLWVSILRFSSEFVFSLKNIVQLKGNPFEICCFLLFALYRAVQAKYRFISCPSSATRSSPTSGFIAELLPYAEMHVWSIVRMTKVIKALVSPFMENLKSRKAAAKPFSP